MTRALKSLLFIMPALFSLTTPLHAQPSYGVVTLAPLEPNNYVPAPQAEHRMKDNT